MAGWAYLRHKVHGGETFVLDDGYNVLRHEVLDWERFALPEGISPDDPDPHGQLVALRELGLIGKPEPILRADEVNGLKGKALDEALERAGLPTSGTADEKRARLAAHEADLADNTEKEGAE